MYIYIIFFLYTIIIFLWIEFLSVLLLLHKMSSDACRTFVSYIIKGALLKDQISCFQIVCAKASLKREKPTKKPRTQSLNF